MARSPVVILGMQRSGTSALSAALTQLGLDLGPKQYLYEGDVNNPSGYFEHRMATELNIRFLNDFQLHVTSNDRLPENWEEFPFAQDHVKALANFFGEQYGKPARIGLKQPMASLLLPIYNRAFERLGLTPRYVVCFRNPLENMDSEANLDFGTDYRVMQSLGSRAIGSWLRYTLGAICEAAPYSVTLVDYDDLLDDPIETLERVIAVDPDWHPTSEQWEVAGQQIKRDQKRSRRTESELDGLPRLVKDLYRELKANSKLAELSNRARFNSISEEFQSWVRLMEPGRKDYRGLVVWRSNGQPKTLEFGSPSSPAWSEVTLELEAPPLTVLSCLFAPAAARVWIRTCEWISDQGSEDVELRPGLGSSLTLEHDLDCLRTTPNFQLHVRTPASQGPYRLKIEYFIQSGESTQLAAVESLSRSLSDCVSRLTRRVAGI